MRAWVFLAALFILGSCTPKTFLRKRLSTAETQFHDHVGFILYGPGTKKTLIEYNAGKYFTPASNTKVFTFYTALQLLGDSVPALKYTVTNDSLIFWGTGDPSFLYQQTFTNSRVYDFIKGTPQRLFFSHQNFQSKHFGPGWAWDDYAYTYSSERSSFPIYGNFVDVSTSLDEKLIIVPSRFATHVVMGDSVISSGDVIRDLDSNRITFYPGKKRTSGNRWRLPFRASSGTVISLLSDTLKRQIDEINYPLSRGAMTLYSVPTDSLYKSMMQNSDNFIAEQLLLICAGVVSDSLNTDVAIRFARKNFLFDLPDEPVWVDGSGLSRYNLFTPRTMARLWEKIYIKVSRERLFKLLAVGGKTGTLRNWYCADKPYIFGKTGSLSNNHSLSGFLISRKGKVLIFSFMNSNFITSGESVRKMMEEVLVLARDKY